MIECIPMSGVLVRGRRLVIEGQEATFDEWETDDWFFYIGEDNDTHVARTDMIDHIYM